LSLDFTWFFSSTHQTPSNTVEEDPLFEFTDFDIIPRHEEGTQLAKPPCVSAKIDRKDPLMSISYKVWKYRQNGAARAGTLDGTGAWPVADDSG